MLINKNAQVNGFLMALYLFQFPFLIPFSQILEPKLIVSFISFIVCIALVFKNRSSKVNNNVVFTYFILLILFLLKWIVGQADDSVLVTLIIYVTPVLILFLYPFDCAKCLKTMFVLSKFGFFFLFWLPFTSFYHNNYMRFGYGMLSIVVFAYIELVHHNAMYVKKKENYIDLINIAIVLFGGIEILLYGARGSTFSLVVFVLLDNFVVKRFNFLGSFTLLFAAIFSYYNIELILQILKEVVDFFGVRSYAFIKFQMQLSQGFERAASGRVAIYESKLEYFLQHFWFGGNISFDERYAHNIFLQVGSDFGIFAIILIAFVILYSMYLMYSNTLLIVEKIFLLSLFTLSFGRLTFSSTIWQRPEFWMLVFFILTIKYNKNCVSEASKDLEKVDAINNQRTLHNFLG